MIMGRREAGTQTVDSELNVALGITNIKSMEEACDVCNPTYYLVRIVAYIFSHLDIKGCIVV
jgi:hypothetical protein